MIKNERILSILAISKNYKQRPSEILGIKNDYEAFCLDEACIYILNQLADDKEPDFSTDENREINANKKTIEWMMKNSKPIA